MCLWTEQGVRAYTKIKLLYVNELRSQMFEKDEREAKKIYSFSSLMLDQFSCKNNYQISCIVGLFHPR